MSSCSLCGLSIPDDPVTAADVEGTFCCRGCLEVSATLDDVDGLERERVVDRARESTDREVPAGAEETFLAVDGMHCSTCEGFVSLLGEDEPGILTVEASYATDTARIVYDPDRLERADLPETLSATATRRGSATATAAGETRRNWSSGCWSAASSRC